MKRLSQTSVYPNPASNFITISLPGLEQSLQHANNDLGEKLSSEQAIIVKFFNETSELVHLTEMKKDELLIPMENFKTGIYELKLFFKSEELHSETILVK